MKSRTSLSGSTGWPASWRDATKLCEPRTGCVRQMLADVSHELKTPLTAMRGYVETLRMTDVTLDGVARKRCLDTLERETLRLDRSSKTCSISRAWKTASARSTSESLPPVGCSSTSSIDMNRRQTARDIQLTTRVTPGADQMVGDPDRIEQVIENLVANALRHTPDGGTIEVGAAVVGDSIRLSVVDSGKDSAGARSPRLRSLLQGRPSAGEWGNRQRPRTVDRQGDRRAAHRNHSRDERVRSHRLHDPASSGFKWNRAARRLRPSSDHLTRHRRTCSQRPRPSRSTRGPGDRVRSSDVVD